VHGGVMFRDGLRRERLGVFLYPRFEFGIGRLVLIYVILNPLFIEPECGTGHRIEAFADGGITRSEFTRCFERDFLPKTREMDNAEGAGNAGADQSNEGITHMRKLMVDPPSRKATARQVVDVD